MKFTKSQSYSLLAAMVAVANTTAAHRANVQPFGPELAHREFIVSTPTEPGHALVGTSTLLSQKVATDFVENHLTSSDYIVKNVYSTKHNGVTHVYLRQRINGLEVVNGDINVNVDRHGRVISYGDSFYKGRQDRGQKPLSIKNWIKKEAESFVEQGRQLAMGRWRRRPLPIAQVPKTIISPRDALLSFARYINVEILRPEDMYITSAFNPKSENVEVFMANCPLTANGQVPVSKAYIQTEDGALELVYDFQVQMKNSDNWFHTQVHAETGKVMQIIDWVADATYNVYPMGVNDPHDGERRLLVDPEHLASSPLGWNRQDKRTSFNTTIGNNVYAGENRRNGNDWENNPKPEGKVDKAGNLTFDFKIDLEKDPSTYVDAAVTNLFYWNNQMHDISYNYGFDEQSGNFQENNFGRGGLGNDAVIANAQDGSGYNNANFATPPDGQHGQMRMYLWDVTEVLRDGDLESGIIIHEYTHGISTRLTGGPANSGCLIWGEAGGMGEGWGDFFATLFRQNATHDYNSEFEMGSYANGGVGIRRFPYSTSFKTNPQTFKTMDGRAYWGVHAKGTVWALMLFEMYQNLRRRLPFTDDWYTNDKASYANTLALQLVIDGMKLQPCMPSFAKARDAILQAEQLLTEGEYHCDIWRAFAKRGLGPKARVIGANSPFGGLRSESFEVPRSCAH